MHIKNNRLFLEKFSAEFLSKKFGTPLYVYEAETIRRNYLELKKNITYPRLEIYYACKQNTNISILKLLRNMGSKIETVSRGEITQAFKAGFKSEDIIYTSTSVTEEELAFVIKNKIKINLDSLFQIELYGKMNPNTDVGIRINQGLGGGSHNHLITGGPMSKFGIPLPHLSQAKKLAKKYKLKIVRLHQHIGSNILDGKILLEAFDKLLETAVNFPDLESLDFGGGLGIPYFPKEKNLDIKFLGLEMKRRMQKFCQKYSRKLVMIIEPGRFLVAQSGILLAKVTEIKINPKRSFVGLNTGMNHLVRPAMYNSYHKIINASRFKGKSMKADIVGNICESGDFLGRDRIITYPKIGDILAICDVGASGYVMASEYNSRPLPKQVLIDGNIRLI